MSPASTLDALRREARGCTACPLWRNATQTVFGRGDPQARVVLVGEQPGDAEDRQGAPFVGPAGRVLDRAIAEAGLDRVGLYVTNAVKHFKWEPRGKRRLHKTPAQAEVDACRRWLDGELAAVAPVLAVCLGATATHALIDARTTLTAVRGRILARERGPALLATIHPSFVLRLREGAREAAYRGLVADLALALSFATGHAPGDEARASSRRV